METNHTMTCGCCGVGTVAVRVDDKRQFHPDRCSHCGRTPLTCSPETHAKLMAAHDAQQDPNAAGSLCAQDPLCYEKPIPCPHHVERPERRPMADEEPAGEVAADAFMRECSELHPATACLVWNFALALANKLREAEKKYGYSDGWRTDDWMDECRTKLVEHVAKGDPRDVAAYCAFLWHHGQRTALPRGLPAGSDALVLLDKMYQSAWDRDDGFPCPVTSPVAFAEHYTALRELLATAKQPSGSDIGAWLWCKLMDWCKARRVHPVDYNDLFSIVADARKEIATAEQPSCGQDARDAARYRDLRWIAQNGDDTVVVVYFADGYWLETAADDEPFADIFDRSIDAAIAAQQRQGGAP